MYAAQSSPERQSSASQQHRISPTNPDPMIYPGLYSPSGFDVLDILVRLLFRVLPFPVPVVDSTNHCQDLIASLLTIYRSEFNVDQILDIISEISIAALHSFFAIMLYQIILSSTAANHLRDWQDTLKMRSLEETADFYNALPRQFDLLEMHLFRFHKLH